jgi:hypothetical protein
MEIVTVIKEIKVGINKKESKNIKIYGLYSVNYLTLVLGLAIPIGAVILP